MTAFRHRFPLLLFLFALSNLALGAMAHFDIPAQPLPEALRLFAQQAQIQLVYKPDAVSGSMSNPVIGQFESRVALEKLLERTGFEVMFTAEDAATIRPMQRADRGTENSGGENSGDERDTVIVTGSHIAGETSASSPLLTFTRQDIQRSGASTTELFLRTLPQNFGGGRNGLADLASNSF